MKIAKSLNGIALLILFVAISAVAFIYNASVTDIVTKKAYNDYEILLNYNTEIIAKLCNQESIDEWSKIVEQYQDIVIVIENKNNRVVTRSKDRTWAALDVKVQTPFKYKDEPYLIRTSIYLLRDYVADTRAMTKFIFIELIIGLSALLVLFIIMYKIMLKPYKVIYRAIGEYDRTGKIDDVKLKGYAGKFFGRFVSMARNLERQRENQRNIIASISHDIKTPLTSIMGYTEQLKKDTLSAERRERYLDTVYEKAADIQNLVEEFDEYLGYNIPYELEMKPVAVKDIEACILSDYSDDMAFSDVLFCVNNITDPNTIVTADTQKLKRVCSNILGNSVKHFNNSDRRIRIDITSEEDKVIFMFNDSGEGVPEDKLDLIFEPLYTSDEGRKVAGLGLSICREIVEAHRGKIYAEKSDMGGLAVCIELPGGYII